MSEPVHVVELLKQFAAESLDLAALEKQIADGYDLATEVSDNLDAIKADPEAAAGLVLAFCASRPCSEDESDENDGYSINGRSYPIAAALNDDDRYKVWSELPALIRSFIDAPPEGFGDSARAVEADIETLVTERYVTPGFWSSDEDPNYDERAKWVEAGLWNDDLEAAVDAEDVAEEDQSEVEDEAEAEAELEEGIEELEEVERELEGEAQPGTDEQ